MKIALLIHDINNLGGIITYVERLAKGFIEAGHQCDILKLQYLEKSSESRTRAEGYHPGETDLLVHSIYGWSFPLKNRIPYKGDALNSAIERLNSYDLIIWETPAPSMSVSKDKRENLEWMNLFKNSAKQIITIHDGNLIGLYPHLSKAIEGVSGITVTAPHPRGFNSSRHLGLDHTLVMIPQYMPDDRANFYAKKKGFSAVQIFKAWKHVDEPVRAISYMQSKEKSSCKLRVIAGTGLHYYYMTSPDKCKHFHPKHAREDLVDKRIWDTALENGMEYPGILNFQERDELLSRSLLFLDPSWVDDGLGNHLNGAVPEAIRMGCVPVGKPLTFRQNLDDDESIYQPGINYLEIPQNATDMEYAEALEEFSNISYSVWKEITERNYQMLGQYFDYHMVAQQLIDQAFHGISKSGAIAYEYGSGELSELLKISADKILSTFNESARVRTTFIS